MTTTGLLFGLLSAFDVHAQYVAFSVDEALAIFYQRNLDLIATQAAESDFRDAVRIFSNMVRDAYYDLLQAQKNRWLAQDRRSLSGHCQSQ